MLVLSRRIGQQIRIGNSVVVTLLRVDRNKARIGVEAPPGIPVFRQELLDFESTRSTKMAKINCDRPLCHNERNNKSDLNVVSPRFLWDGAVV
jgi:carbon storage regulator